MIQNTILPGFKLLSSTKLMLLAGVLAGGFVLPPVQAQSPAPAVKSVATLSPTHYQPNRLPRRAAAFYALRWGVDSLIVKTAESGELIRFSYHILDPEKAMPLNDKETEAFLEVPAAHIRLVIPSLEKVGKLRQSSAPEAGRSYWMAFSNPGRPVKRGDRVNVVIGSFHADGLIVE